MAFSYRREHAGEDLDAEVDLIRSVAGGLRAVAGARIGSPKAENGPRPAARLMLESGRIPS
jgi:hypothetical protein